MGTPERVEVYSGYGTARQTVERELHRLGIPFQTGDRAGSSPGAVGALQTENSQTRSIWVTEEEYNANQDRIEAILAEVNPASHGDQFAMQEAEEDYDVRGCPACMRFYHDCFAACPLCAGELVPGVELLDADQTEPDCVVVAVGPETDMVNLMARLRVLDFAAEAGRAGRPTLALLTLPWTELVDRTAEAEALLRRESLAASAGGTD
ncbi:MAG: hypothetical protein FJX77_06645 [Armatimonadetes bacterium]|nr:hypothetical protein [Armatimonadota bacterium]